ncbi:hypothetical protein QFZ73_002010 [Peribacillus sp. V2I11]|nr:hypothetical protein [Peribacillus sp. V2I11]
MILFQRDQLEMITFDQMVPANRFKEDGQLDMTRSKNGLT